MSYTNQLLPYSKPHYRLLDALRGVAALIVVIYHLGEAFATSVRDQWCNHGYLAVQFFFVLSGFVVSYAYSDRMGTRNFGIWEFFKRRLIRLHPMVVLGAILGFGAFLIQGSTTWSGVHIEFKWVVLALIATLFLIPISPSSPLDVRGNGELFPLNGPFWSLFCEYVGNILFALFIRRLKLPLLIAWWSILAVSVAAFAIGNGSGFYHLGVGWTMADGSIWGGLLCMTFCFSSGVLLQRLFVLNQSKRLPRLLSACWAFWLSTAVLVAALATPYLGGEEHGWMNGIFDAICVIAVFPSLVWICACAEPTTPLSIKSCALAGEISYPLYAVHYPSMYLYYHWVWTNDITIQQALPACFALVIGNIALAYCALRFYGSPVRKYLSSKFIYNRRIRSY